MRNEQVDAWMFLAVAHGRSEAVRVRLSDLIATADWINHAIPLDEELRGGLNHLIAEGLVDVNDGAFGLTASGEALFAKVRKRAGIWKQWERLEDAFGRLDDLHTPTWMPSDDELAAAVEAYQDRARAIIDSLMQGR